MAMLITNGLVVTLDPDALHGRVIENGAVAVEGGSIVAVGQTRDIRATYPEAAPVLDASGKIVMPGFIVTHTHMPYVLGHNMPVDASKLRTFWDMLQKMGWEWLEDITTPDGIYAATCYAAMKMLMSGTTTVCELVEGPNAIPGALSASAKAVDEVGIRAQIGFEVTERIPGVSIRERQDRAMADKGFEENRSLLSRFPAKGKGRIQGRLGVHTAYTNSMETLSAARRFADEHGCGIQIHVAEIPRAFLVEKYGKSAPMVLEERGVLGPDVIAAHCIDLTDEDLQILKRNGVNVAHTPMTNSFGGNGVARVPDMLAAGMNVTIGHDCFFTLDISEYIRYAYLVHKAHNANPGLIPPFQAVDMATGNAARALGLGDRIGSLAPGKCADILIVNPDCPVPLNASSVMSWFTMTFQGRDVETVIVDGKIVVKDHRMTTVNEGDVRKACVEEAAKLWRKNGAAV
jgi:cytosine/adenosine deaminase-related metal-dependent hydrolase